MEAHILPKGLPRPDMRKMVIWTVLVLMVVSSLAIMPDEAEAQGPGRKDITFYFHNVSSGAQVGSPKPTSISLSRMKFSMSPRTT